MVWISKHEVAVNLNFDLVSLVTWSQDRCQSPFRRTFEDAPEPEVEPEEASSSTTLLLAYSLARSEQEQVLGDVKDKLEEKLEWTYFEQQLFRMIERLSVPKRGLIAESFKRYFADEIEIPSLVVCALAAGM